MTKNVKGNQNKSTLHILLIFISFGVLLTGYYLFAPGIATNYYSGVNLAVKKILLIPSLVFTFGLWKYKKWGIYGSFLVALVSDFLNILDGRFSLFGILILLVMYFLIWKYYWKMFK